MSRRHPIEDLADLALAFEHDSTFLQMHLPDGRAVLAYRLTYGRARLGVGPSATCGWFTDEW